MALRCGCPAQGDEIVFGPVHECWPESKHAANLAAELDRLEREDPAVQAVLRDPYDMDDDERSGR